jgi:hypothetical protein
MFYARIAIATCMEASAPRDGEECPCFNAKLRLFQNASAPSSSAEHPDSLTLKTIVGQHVPIVNIKGRKIGVDEEFIVGQTIDERWVIISDVPHPRIQFVTTGKIIGQSVPVKVLRVQNSAPNLSSGFLKHGDTLEIKDPFNLFADIELDATGWAYYVAESEDDTETESTTEPTHEARYEIEECSLPINELKGTISTCLKFLNETKQVTVNVGPDSIRSAYNNVDVPPEASAGSSVIDAQNNFNLDAVADSNVIIQRITNLGPSEPEDYTVGGGSATSAEWQIIRVEQKIARWTDVRFTGGEWVQTGSVWDGFDPSAAGCPPEVIPTAMDCLPKEETLGIACYNPTTHKYVVVSTASALLGPPALHQVVQGTDSQSNQNISFDTSSCPTINMNYKVMDLYGWSEDEAQDGCAEKDHSRYASLILAEETVMQTYLSTCTGACIFTATGVGTALARWVGSGCVSGCACSYGSSLPNVSTYSNGATIAGTCGNAVDGTAGLCFSTINVLACSSPAAGTPVCIPVTDCPEEDETP